jgi:hypothetical protein
MGPQGRCTTQELWTIKGCPRLLALLRAYHIGSSCQDAYRPMGSARMGSWPPLRLVCNRRTWHHGVDVSLEPCGVSAQRKLLPIEWPSRWAWTPQ